MRFSDLWNRAWKFQPHFVSVLKLDFDTEPLCQAAPSKGRPFEPILWFCERGGWRCEVNQETVKKMMSRLWREGTQWERLPLKSLPDNQYLDDTRWWSRFYIIRGFPQTFQSKTFLTRRQLRLFDYYYCYYWLFISLFHYIYSKVQVQMKPSVSISIAFQWIMIHQIKLIHTFIR